MDFRALIKQISAFYEKINTKQKIVIASTLVVIVGFLSFLIVFSSFKEKPTVSGYSVLFDGVSPSDNALVIQYLQQNNIPYQIPKEDTILVPSSQVYEQRIALASMGLPKSSKVGFEIFDTKDFGATDFDQQIKFIRATEGELSRTIESLVPIKKASVHIAMPKDSVFVSKSIPPTASVVLNIQKNMVLSSSQIIGIKNLVSAAITSLDPENVKIVNENGETLGENTDEASSQELAKLANMQLKYKQNYEKILEDKIVNILIPVVGGRDRVVAKVTAEFDFRQTKSTQESFDPNNVVRSEQSLEEKREGTKPKEIGGIPGAVSNIGPVEGIDSGNGEKYEKSTNTTNYEIGKTVSEIKGEFGVLSRLSAAVVVDGKYQKVDKDGSSMLEYIPLSQTQMGDIDSLVKKTIGFNQGRGDEVSVSNFELNAKVQSYKPVDKWDNVNEMIVRYVTPFAPALKYLLVFFVIIIFYKKIISPFAQRMMQDVQEEEDDVRSLLDDEDVKQADTRMMEIRKKVQEQIGGGAFDEDDVKYEVLIEKMKELISEKPQEVASLFQTLIKDELSTEK